MISGLAALALMAAAAMGALHPRPWPLTLMAAIVGAVAALFRARLRAAVPLTLLGVALLTSFLAHRSLAGLDPGATRLIEGWATVITDPDPSGSATRVVLGLNGQRAEAWLRGPPAAALSSALAGERVWVSGRVRPLASARAERLRSQHIGAALEVDSVGSIRPGAWWHRAANGLRRLLARGASSLDLDQRSLLTGVVLGDDRHQSDGTVSDFRASGLSHLLAVSGQNLVLLLGLAHPALMRLGIMSRWLTAVGLILLFGTMTRWEPSILRAAVMAIVTLSARTVAAPRLSPLAALGSAGALLLIVDPLLVRSLGFLLSVGACLGIAIAAAPIARSMPGPRWFKGASSITLAAQIGVAPVILPVFGTLPLASIPANLVAVPLAGALMTWGLVAGLAAGVVGSPLSNLFHIPTRLLAEALHWVAAESAGLGLGHLTSGTALAVVAVLPLAWLAQRRRSKPIALLLAGTAVVATTLLPVGGPSGAAPDRSIDGAHIWHVRPTVVALDGAFSRSVLDRLRVQRVRTIDVVVSRRGSSVDATTLALLRQRFTVGVVLAPRGGRVAGVDPGAGGQRLIIGGRTVRAVNKGGTITISVAKDGVTAAR